ncbi:MAG: transcriptional regulator [Clostridia bacterium]|nr:transcriptional regulator [Clostridia bacterium]
MEKFSKRLLELEKDNGINHEDLAKILGLSHVHLIYPWINGEYYPSIPNLMKIARYFECSLEYLLGRTENTEIAKYKDNKVNFIDRFENIIKDKHITKTSLVKSGIISFDNIHQWKKNNRTPRLETIIKLADYLNVSIDYLVGRE